MRGVRFTSAWPVLVAIAACLPALADNPKVSLKLEAVTASEAAAALSRTVGVPVTLFQQTHSHGQLEPLSPRLDARADFDWSGLHFADALRQLCDRYGLRADRREGGYLLFDWDDASPLGKPQGQVDIAGIPLLSRMSERSSFGIMKLDGNTLVLQDCLQLWVGCAVPGGDPEVVDGVANVTALDDRGTLLLSGDGVSSECGYSAVYPDEWTGVVTLTPPDPAAARLRWVVGDLVHYRKYRRFAIEVPLRPGAKSLRFRRDEVTIDVASYEQASPLQEAPGDCPRGDDQTQVFLDAVITISAGSPVSPLDGERTITPVLLKASGQPLSPCNTGFRSSVTGAGVYRVASLYRGSSDEPVTAIFPMIERSEPERLCSFRLEDIELPARRGRALRTEAPVPPARPFFSPSGGTLLSSVSLQGRTAAAGTVLLGLAVKGGPMGGPLRWITLPVDSHGEARLPDLAPGAYRVRRFYRPDQMAEPLPHGHWENGDAEIEVVAGKETVAPPLRWAADPGK